MSSSEKAWHAMEADEAVRRLESSAEGLSSEKATGLHKRFGPNTLEAEESAGPMKLLIHQVHNPLIYLLVGAAALSLIGRERNRVQTLFLS